MKKFHLLFVLLASAGFVSGLGAQVRGEVDPAQSRAAPVERATPAEKKAARAQRKQEGAQVARRHPTGDDQPMTTAKAPRAPKDVRLTAREQRRANVAGAVRRGEIPSGEK